MIKKRTCIKIDELIQQQEPILLKIREFLKKNQEEINYSIAIDWFFKDLTLEERFKIFIFKNSDIIITIIKMYALSCPPENKFDYLISFNYNPKTFTLLSEKQILNINPINNKEESNNYLNSSNFDKIVEQHKEIFESQFNSFRQSLDNIDENSALTEGNEEDNRINQKNIIESGNDVEDNGIINESNENKVKDNKPCNKINLRKEVCNQFNKETQIKTEEAKIEEDIKNVKSEQKFKEDKENISKVNNDSKYYDKYILSNVNKRIKGQNSNRQFKEFDKSKLNYIGFTSEKNDIFDTMVLNPYIFSDKKNFKEYIKNISGEVCFNDSIKIFQFNENSYLALPNWISSKDNFSFSENLSCLIQIILSINYL